MCVLTLCGRYFLQNVKLISKELCGRVVGRVWLLFIYRGQCNNYL